MRLTNVALWISFLRIVLAPFVVIYLSDNPNKVEIVLALVIIAGFSDFVDGYVARSQNMVSQFGAILDYTADKVFVLSTLVILSIAGDLPAWITLIVLYREMLVMGERLFATYKNIEIPAGKLGKLKTVMLFLGIGALLLKFDFAMYIFYFAILLTVISFFEYTVNFFKALPDSNQ